MTTLTDRADWLSARLDDLPDPPRTVAESEAWAQAAYDLADDLEEHGATVLAGGGSGGVPGGWEVSMLGIVRGDETLDGACRDWIAAARSRTTFAALVTVDVAALARPPHPLEAAAAARRRA